MPPSSSQTIALTIIVSTSLLLLFGSIIVRYIFLHQRKRFRHKQEITEMKDAFNNTLLQSKLEIQEQTLDHISKELHANIGQLASLININLSTLLSESSESVQHEIEETKALAKQLLFELKVLSSTLNTDHITKVGFENALEKELQRLGRVKKMQITFTKKGQEYHLSPSHQTILFRLCQEVLNNIIKYANATAVTILLQYSEDSFELEISDDGEGFDIDEAFRKSVEKDSTGLSNIKTRAQVLGGTVSIKSSPGKGSQVKIIIPQNKS